jgi:uncharacterized membrane protein YsdA (DUF1294 family)
MKSFLHFCSFFSILAIARLCFWTEPFGISVDESNYMAIAEAWNHYGRPYIDGVDRKPPLLYAVYWAVGSIFGFFHLHAIHALTLLGMAGLAYLTDAWVRRISPQTPRGVGAFFLVLLSSSLSREILAFNSELCMLFFLIPGFFLVSGIDFLRPKKSDSILLLAAGALFAFATLVKQIAVLPIGLSALALWIWSAQNSLLGLNLKRSALLAASFFASLLLAIGLLSRFTDLSEVYFWVIGENLGYVQDAKAASSEGRAWLAPLGASLLWISFWIFAGAALRKHWRNPQVVFLSAALLGAFLSIYVGSRLFSHYFVPTLFFLAPLAALGWACFSKRLRHGLLAFSVLVFVVFAAFNHSRDFWVRLVSDRAKIHSFDLETQARLNKIAQKIKEISQPEARMAVWGMAGQLYLMAERGSATRFIYADYVSGRLAGFHSPESRPNPRALDLYLQDFEEKLPEIFVDLSGARINDYQYFPLSRYPLLQERIDSDYVLVANVEGADIYQRSRFRANEN